MSDFDVAELVTRLISDDPSERTAAETAVNEALDANPDRLLAIIRFAVDADPSSVSGRFSWLMLNRWAGGGGYSRMTAEGAASLRRILLETIDGTMPDKVSLALPAVMAVFEEIVRNGKEWQDLRQVLDHWGTDVATYGFFMGLFVTGASVKDGALFGALFEAELAGPMTAQLFSSGPDALDAIIGVCHAVDAIEPRSAAATAKFCLAVVPFIFPALSNLSYSGNGEVLVQVVEILSRCLVQIDRAFPQRDMVGGKFLNACFAVLEIGSAHGVHARELTAITSLMISIIEMYSTCFDKEVDLAAVYTLLLKLVGKIDDSVLQGEDPVHVHSESGEGTSSHHSVGDSSDHGHGHEHATAEVGGGSSSSSGSESDSGDSEHSSEHGSDSQSHDGHSHGGDSEDGSMLHDDDGDDDPDPTVTVHAIGVSILEVLSKNLPSSAIYDPVMAMVIPHLQSPDARVRYGVLSVVDAICLGCEVRMKSDLESLLAVLFPLVGDGSPGVVIQLLSTLMTLMESLFPESEKYIASVVKEAIPLILHPHPRVASVAMDLVVTNMGQISERAVSLSLVPPVLENVMKVLNSETVTKDCRTVATNAIGRLSPFIVQTSMPLLLAFLNKLSEDVMADPLNYEKAALVLPVIGEIALNIPPESEEHVVTLRVGGPTFETVLKRCVDLAMEGIQMNPGPFTMASYTFLSYYAKARREDIITRADEISSIVKKTITVPRRLSKLVMKVEALQELFRMLRRFALEVPMEFSALFMNKKFIGEFVRVCATLAMFDRDIGDAGILCCHDIVNGLLKGVDADDIPAKARDCVSIILRYLVDQIRCEDLETACTAVNAMTDCVSTSGTKLLGRGFASTLVTLCLPFLNGSARCFVYAGEDSDDENEDEQLELESHRKSKSKKKDSVPAPVVPKAKKVEPTAAVSLTALMESPRMQACLTEVIDLLSEIVELMGAEFAPEFSRVWPPFLALIRANPDDELSAAMLGLIGRTALGLGGALKPVIPVLQEFVETSSRRATTRIRHNTAYCLGSLYRIAGRELESFLPRAYEILMSYLELRSMSSTDVLVVDNAVSSVLFVIESNVAKANTDALKAVLNWLPIKRDDDEIQNVYGVLLRLLAEDAAVLRSEDVFPLLLGGLVRVRNVTLATGPVVDTPALIQSRISDALLDLYTKHKDQFVAAANKLPAHERDFLFSLPCIAAELAPATDASVEAAVASLSLAVGSDEPSASAEVPPILTVPPPPAPPTS